MKAKGEQNNFRCCPDDLGTIYPDFIEYCPMCGGTMELISYEAAKENKAQIQS
jgi:hypothetical protein